jgi:hypothetical protein
MEDSAKVLGIKSLDDWYKVRTLDLVNLGKR